MGVEEEFLLVEPGTGRPQAVAGTVLQAAGQAAGSDLEAELQQQQLETNSQPCQSLDDLHRELRRCRAAAATAAGRAGAQVAALGTSPVPVQPEPVRTSRYERMVEDYGLTAHEQLTPELLTALLTRGNGAAFQRAAYQRSGRLSDVINSVVHVTQGD